MLALIGYVISLLSECGSYLRFGGQRDAQLKPCRIKEEVRRQRR